MNPVTEITLTGGERLRIEADVREVESAIVSAARGSILELAWLTDARTGQRFAVNPDHVLMLRAIGEAGAGSD